MALNDMHTRPAPGNDDANSLTARKDDVPGPEKVLVFNEAGQSTDELRSAMLEFLRSRPNSQIPMHWLNRDAQSAAYSLIDSGLARLVRTNDGLAFLHSTLVARIGQLKDFFRRSTPEH